MSVFEVWKSNFKERPRRLETSLVCVSVSLYVICAYDYCLESNVSGYELRSTGTCLGSKHLSTNFAAHPKGTKGGPKHFTNKLPKGEKFIT